MELRTVELMSPTEAEPAVVRLPDRELPGVLVSAEALHSLLRELRAAHEQAASVLGAEEALGLARVVSQVGDWMKSLERAGARNGLRLPFASLESEKEWAEFKDQLDGLLKLLPSPP